MELLLINYLEERRKNSYVDVEIIEYTIDGVNCNVKFSYVDSKNMFKTIEKEETINLWDVAVFNNYKNNNR